MGGKIIFQGAYGEANKDFRVRNNLETKFNLGSINKMVTAIAIAQLVEQNKLSFDDSLSKYIPDFPYKYSSKKIKISHLLSHTSGLVPKVPQVIFLTLAPLAPLLIQSAS